MNVNDIRNHLFDLQDLKYKDFHCKLIPTVDSDSVIGVRTPMLRKLAKEITSEEAEKFLKDLPHKYYEENNLHGFLIEKINDYDKCIEALNNFLPYVNNWATCDMMSPKVFKKNKAQLLNEIKSWMAAEDTYTIRFGIGMLMKYFLDEDFKPEFLSQVAEIKSDEYYIKMMIAWYFATALAKQYDAAVAYLEEMRLCVWVHNKTIQKAVESYRITDEQKEYLKALRIRGG